MPTKIPNARKLYHTLILTKKEDSINISSKKEMSGILGAAKILLLPTNLPIFTLSPSTPIHHYE